MYQFFFGNKTRIFFWLFVFDSLLFGTFYTMYMLSMFNFITSTAYYVTTISVVFINNMIGLIFMIIVLFNIYFSMKSAQNQDQKHLIKNRKRLAWIILCQSIINFILCFSRIIGFYNVSLAFGGRPTINCYNPLFNFYNSFSYFFQEILVCIDCMIYLFLLTSYREQMVIFLKKMTRNYETKAIQVTTVPGFVNSSIVHPR